MSRFNYQDCFLTYWLPSISMSFKNELHRAIRLAVNDVEVSCKIVITDTVTESTESQSGQTGTIAFLGFYCLFVFANDVDRTLFKMTIPSDNDLLERVLRVLQMH